MIEVCVMCLGVTDGIWGYVLVIHYQHLNPDSPALWNSMIQIVGL
jgi:hypothetical protein